MKYNPTSPHVCTLFLAWENCSSLPLQRVTPQPGCRKHQHHPFQDQTSSRRLTQSIPISAFRRPSHAGGAMSEMPLPQSSCSFGLQVKPSPHASCSAAAHSGRRITNRYIRASSKDGVTFNQPPNLTRTVTASHVVALRSGALASLFLASRTRLTTTT